VLRTPTAEIDALAIALVRCTVVWDGGTVKPKPQVDHDREAAKWVLSVGGAIQVDNSPVEHRGPGALPKYEFLLTGIFLDKNARATDDTLAILRNCVNLTTLSLGATAITDDGLAIFKGRQNITVLIMPGTKATDAGLAHFKECKGLVQLDLNGTPVTDAGLAHFKD